MPCGKARPADQTTQNTAPAPCCRAPESLRRPAQAHCRKCAWCRKSSSNSGCTRGLRRRIPREHCGADIAGNGRYTPVAAHRTTEQKQSRRRWHARAAAAPRWETVNSAEVLKSAPEGRGAGSKNASEAESTIPALQYLL